MSVKISELPAADSVATSDVVPIVDVSEGITKKATIAQIETAILPVDLAGGSAQVTGELPLANQAAPTGTGYIFVTDGEWPAAGAAVNLAGGSSHVTGLLPVTNIAPSASNGHVLQTVAGVTAWGAVPVTAPTSRDESGTGTLDDVVTTSGGSNVDVIRLTSVTDVTITGFDNPSANREIEVIPVEGITVTYADSDGGSTDGQRIENHGGQDLTISGVRVKFRYDSGQAAWVPMVHDRLIDHPGGGSSFGGHPTATFRVARVPAVESPDPVLNHILLDYYEFPIITISGDSDTSPGAGTLHIGGHPDENNGPDFLMLFGESGITLKTPTVYWHDSVADTSSVHAYNVSARVNTTDATVTTLVSFALAGLTGGLYAVMVRARESTAPDTAAWQFIVAINGSSAITAGDLDTPTYERKSAGAATWDCELDINTGNLRVRGTGEASNNIQWKVHLYAL